MTVNHNMFIIESTLMQPLLRQSLQNSQFDFASSAIPSAVDLVRPRQCACACDVQLCRHCVPSGTLLEAESIGNSAIPLPSHQQ
eukprot:m.1588950 g.1588950  ORF g.1588950 m.1588950 type:complete len:84 (+) comp25333_c0_seq3:7721-7972(+)